MPSLIPVASQLSDDILNTLPDDVQDKVVSDREKRDQILRDLTDDIIKKRDEAVKFRQACGIENEWTEDEEFYDGIDDANRSEPRMIKPNHPSGAVTSFAKKNKKTRSTIFMNITRQYVDTAAASVSEMNNPNDDRNFQINPIGNPKIDSLKDSTDPYDPTGAIKAEGFLSKFKGIFGTKPQQPSQPQMTMGQWAQQQIKDAEDRAKAAQEQIDNWLIKCNWHAEMRSAVIAAAKIGTGILKGPVPAVHRTKRTVESEDGKTKGLIIKDEILPTTSEISCWNLYPDTTCGDSIHKGSFLFEKAEMNARQLLDLKKIDGYMSSQIDEAIKLGPKKQSINGTGSENHGFTKEVYEIWYYYGLLDREQIEALGVKDQFDTEEPEDQKQLHKIEQLEACPCVVTLVGDFPIKASLNPLDSGEYPYDLIVWEPRPNSPWGRGVSRIGRPAQRIVVASVRNLMDNAGVSAGVILGIKKGAVTPLGSGDWKLGPQTVLQITDESVENINNVLSAFEVPSRQKELLEIIQWGQKMYEDITGMPLLLQGQQGSAPETVGGMQLLNKNATSTRRMIARRIDDDMVEPHIRRYYDWILMYGDESMKGDMCIDARGSQALVERDIQRQTSIEMLAYAKEPAYGIDARKAMAEALRAEMCNPKDWQYTDEEFKNIQQQQAQNGNPQIAAANIRAQATIEAAKIHAAESLQDSKIRAQGEVQSTQMRTQRDTLADETAQRALNAKSMTDMQLQERELLTKEHIAILQYATMQKVSLQDVKAQLAQHAMTINNERQLEQNSQSLEAGNQELNRQHEARLQEQQHQHESVQTGFTQGQQSSDASADRAHQQQLDAMNRQHEQRMSALQQTHERELAQTQQAHELKVAKLKPAKQPQKK